MRLRTTLLHVAVLLTAGCGGSTTNGGNGQPDGSAGHDGSSGDGSSSDAPSAYDAPKAGKERYQIASERIMAEIAKLHPPPVSVI